MNIKKILFAVLTLFIVSFTHASAQVTSLNDLNYWGTGANRAGFVIAWNDGKPNDTLAWGYQWDGALNFTDMVYFLAANDPNLFLRLDSVTGFGTSIFGVGYQTTSTPFAVTGAEDTLGNPVVPTFTAGINDMNITAGTDAPLSSSGAAPLNAFDHYVEAWNDNGFWELFFHGTDSFTPTASVSYPATWQSSWLGASGTPLVNDGWYALSISEPDYTSNIPGSAIPALQPTPIPEPRAYAMMLLGAVLGALAWLNRHKRSIAAQASA